ncbi:diacylglycerol kinase family protein [Enterococcus casseliflavus]|uniref:diacylglycerol kinase family protein n=1 Tax=Enterococcus casseliflavus TaxID=37734 RepID=UPI0035D76AF2
MDSKDKNIGKNKQFISSIEFAFNGIKTVFKEERNMRKHVALGIVAIIAGFIFRLSQMEWLWLLLAVFLVWIVEIINTVFENVVDMFTDFHFHPIGKKIKDMAAGAVLMTAVFALVVAAIIFLPKLLQLF